MTKTNENTRYQNVKFNDYPDVKDITKPYVVLMISMILFPKYIMTETCAYSYIVQIDVFVKANADYNARLRRNEISQRISDLLWKELKAGQVSNLGNEYNKEFALYRSTRRYEAIFMRRKIKWLNMLKHQNHLSILKI